MSEKLNSEKLSVEGTENAAISEGVQTAATEPTANVPASEDAVAAAADELVNENEVENEVKETAGELSESEAEVTVVEEAETQAEEIVEPIEEEVETPVDEGPAAEEVEIQPEGKTEVSDEEPEGKTEVSDEEPEGKTEESDEAAGSEDDTVEDTAAKVVNYAEKTLSELIKLFEEILAKENRMKLNKEVDALKSSFHRKLQIERDNSDDDQVKNDILTALENDFKGFYESYRKERADYNAKLEHEREENLVKKEAVIADLKVLLEKDEDVSATFPAFREIQQRWRVIGPVPEKSRNAINETYQVHVVRFYDKVKINHELRDLDFKKNLEVKIKFCEAAEKLAESENIVAAFKELQNLHDQWKEYGPVAKQYREEIWDRFKAATAVINKRYQSHFEGLKEHHAENLAAKTALCEKVEEIADREVKTLGDWNAFSKEIEEIQKQWKGIGFATKKENQKIYDRFRAACDKFYARKRDYHTGFKNEMNENYRRKVALCEAAEALKSSTEWKKATDQFLNLQKQWKEIGSVPRKKSELIWKRFRAACDEFFAERDKNFKPENNFYSNLKAKQRLIAEINAYVLSGDDDKDREALDEFSKRWQEIGFVPFREKENIANAYKEALRSKFSEADIRRPRRSASMSPRERLIQKYNELEQDIVRYENNIGYFAQSKSSAPLIMQMQERIAQAKEELKALENEIRNFDSEDSAK